MSAGVAVVTGGAGGLGQAIGERLAADGLAVVLADLRAAATPDGAFAETVDVADAASAQALAERVLERFGRIDVLVNNAGIAGPSADVVDYPPDAFAQVLAVNLLGTFHVTRACLPTMIAAGWGRVVNVASIAGKDGNPHMSGYSASKAGVIGFTKSVAKETVQTGVLVNCLVPGVIDAGLTHHTATAEQRELFRSRVPMGRMGRPDELAELVSWLSSERCSFSTGATYDLTGGRAVY
jgi:2-dehydro-3-deoxy-L-rhamnonate dehydrogenase (NAD+)